MPKINIDFSQSSTVRGLTLVGSGMFAAIAYLIGKDPTPLITIGMTLSGAIGLLFDDKHPPQE